MAVLTAAVTAAALAAASVACLVGLPRPGAVRLEVLRSPEPSGSTAPPLWSVVALTAPPVLLLLGPVVALLLVLGVMVLWRAREVRRRAAGRREERRRAVEACGALAGELRAGRPPGAALAVAAELAIGPSRDALRSAAAAAGLGGDVAAALLTTERTLSGRPLSGRPLSGPPSSGPPSSGRHVPGRPSPGTATAVPEVLRALAACWTVCAASGSGLATAVDRLGEGLRADQDRRRAVEAELAGPRATAGMLAVLPVAGLLLATGLGADPAGVLLHTPLGLACLVGGLLLDGLGLLWTGRLVARAGGSG